MSSFLDLPAELRNQIYGYIAIPDTTPLAAYSGLYLSCHQIRSEMDSECAKLSRSYLANLQDGLHGSRIQLPTSFANMQHVRLDVTYLTLEDDVALRVVIFKGLLPLHLKSLSMVVHVIGEYFSSEEIVYDVYSSACWMGERLETGVVNAQRVGTYYSHVTKDVGESIHDIEYAEYADHCHPKWAVQWKVRPGDGLCGVWKKKDAEGRNEVQTADTTGSVLEGAADDDWVCMFSRACNQ